jgi:hypothetical protein
MKILIDATVWQEDDGSIVWTVDTRPAVEAMGLAPAHNRGVVGVSGGLDQDDEIPEIVSVAIECLAARLARHADSATWSHRLF